MACKAADQRVAPAVTGATVLVLGSSGNGMQISGGVSRPPPPTPTSLKLKRGDFAFDNTVRAAKSCAAKIGVRLVTIPSTEIFSKRRKIYSS